MGSRKFGSFLVVSSMLATTFEMVASLIFDVTPAGGPFGVIYSMFVLYYGKPHLVEALHQQSVEEPFFPLLSPPSLSLSLC